MGIKPSQAAIHLGVSMVERHFCLSRHSFVHHIECSLVPEEFSELVNSVNTIDLKNCLSELPEKSLRTFFGMSDKEYSFLKEDTYGTAHIKGKSKFNK